MPDPLRPVGFEWLSERLGARPPALSDEPAYASLFLKPEVGAWLRPAPLPPFTVNGVRALLRDDVRHWAEHSFGPWALVDRAHGSLVGRAGLRRTRVGAEPVVELVWAIEPDRWGSGLATEAALAAIEWARALELKEVVAMTLPENLASRRVAEKAALRFSGEVKHAGLSHALYRLRFAEGAGR